MNDTPEDILWQRLSKALFGGRKTTDEGLFTYRIMEQVRRLEPILEEVTWHRFLRWAVPILGFSLASLLLATRAPSSMIWPDENPLMTFADDFE